MMRQQGIQGNCKRKFRTTTHSRHQSPVAQNHLQQQFQATVPNQKWVFDITYVPTKEGWLYLAVILDLYSRLVVGWAISERGTDELPLKALKMAITRRTGKIKTSLQQLILHSDQGSQHASTQFRAQLQKHQISQSMSGKGNCFDTAVCESFFATLKIEEVKSHRRGIYSTRRQAMTAIFDYIETFYNVPDDT